MPQQVLAALTLLNKSNDNEHSSEKKKNKSVYIQQNNSVSPL
jgi:hypothetical protein